MTPELLALPAVQRALLSRSQRELADLHLRRDILRLDDEGLSQRTIAELVGLSQPEVSRRLKRRRLASFEESPREIILHRAVGDCTSEQMMQRLLAMTMTSSTPSADAAHDGAVSASGTAAQLGQAYLDGLLTEKEYDQLRGGVKTVAAGSS
ncbi:winged helix-turn-helix transcriptional regulator [Herbiconiux sp. UC225_62]|uniref:winged helix-turn-helix transcriptional regulator n=1 Tax=Herbiconiux sp. UC225_62 TaxID=3350168 RepID=UPI0036D32214